MAAAALHFYVKHKVIPRPGSIVHPGSSSIQLHGVNGIFLQNPEFHNARQTCDVRFKMIRFPRFLEVSEVEEPLEILFVTF